MKEGGREKEEIHYVTHTMTHKPNDPPMKWNNQLPHWEN